MEISCKFGESLYSFIMSISMASHLPHVIAFSTERPYLFISAIGCCLSVLWTFIFWLLTRLRLCFGVLVDVS